MEGNLKVVVFKLNGQRYGLDIQQILSIEKTKEITMVPGTSEYTKGVMNIRGEVIPVIDLKKRLHIQETDCMNNSQILIVNMNSFQIGLIVDIATDVLGIELEAIEPVTEMIGIAEEVYINGLVKLDNELLILLNLEKILGKEASEIKEPQEIIKAN